MSTRRSLAWEMVFGRNVRWALKADRIAFRAVASPSTPEGTPPQLGSAGLLLDVPTRRLRLTSVQEPEGRVRDDGPDYKVIAAAPERWSPR